ncbi:hypothetical protein [Streptomyces sp. NPDC127103]|uniref:hypothetical protein n=1 Tax=Streptomyces sp. NPDC127103 TaxID=3347139 RepID=UPI003657671F
MNDSAFNLREWGEEMAPLAVAFADGFEEEHSYSPGEYSVETVTAQDGSRAVALLAGQGVTGALLEYYATLGIVELPDLHIGIWIADAERVAEGILAGALMPVTGAVDDTVTVFATDGGGNLYAVSPSTGSVCHIIGGAWDGTSLDVSETGYRVVARDLWAFLDQLRQDLRQALAERPALKTKATCCENRESDVVSDAWSLDYLR